MARNREQRKIGNTLCRDVEQQAEAAVGGLWLEDRLVKSTIETRSPSLLLCKGRLWRGTSGSALSQPTSTQEKAVGLAPAGGCYDPCTGPSCSSAGTSSLPRPHAATITAAPPATTATKKAVWPPAPSAMSPAVHAPTAAPTPSAVIVQFSPSVSFPEATDFWTKVKPAMSVG